MMTVHLFLKANGLNKSVMEQQNELRYTLFLYPIIKGLL